VASPLQIYFHPDAGPPYEQLRDGIRRRIEHGTLQPGDRMPTVRACAASHDLAPNTVARAYKDLEREGWIVGRGRAGTFVADNLPAPEDPQTALAIAARLYAKRARELGFSLAEARRTLRDLI
jgi:DNA-binding transcriptional regulator YhcF (GntR family)